VRGVENYGLTAAETEKNRERGNEWNAEQDLELWGQPSAVSLCSPSPTDMTASRQLRESKVMRERIRLVILVGQLGFGGTERQLYLLLRHMDTDRFEPSVLSFNATEGASYAQHIADLGVEVMIVPESCKRIVGRLNFVRRHLKKRKAHIVHSWTFHDNPYAAIGGLFAGIPIRWGSARLSLRASSVLSLPKLIRWLSVFGVQRVVVNAQSLQEELKATRYAPDRITMVPNCVSTFRPQSTASIEFENLGVRSSAPVVGVVANYRRTKNLCSFVRILARVIAEVPTAHGVIVGQTVPGEAEVWDDVRNEIRSLGLERNVCMAGFCDDISGFLFRVSVYCHTSLQEGTPNAVLEAMAEGVPVVASAVDGIVEVITDGKDGFLFAPGNESLAAQRIVSLLENRNLANQMGQSAKNTVDDRFSCAASAGKFMSLYEHAASKFLGNS